MDTSQLAYKKRMCGYKTWLNNGTAERPYRCLVGPTQRCHNKLEYGQYHSCEPDAAKDIVGRLVERAPVWRLSANKYADGTCLEPSL